MRFGFGGVDAGAFDVFDVFGVFDFDAFSALEVPDMLRATTGAYVSPPAYGPARTDASRRRRRFIALDVDKADNQGTGQ
jgi:hypothetical protein